MHEFIHKTRLAKVKAKTVNTVCFLRKAEVKLTGAPP